MYVLVLLIKDSRDGEKRRMIGILTESTLFRHNCYSIDILSSLPIGVYRVYARVSLCLCVITYTEYTLFAL